MTLACRGCGCTDDNACIGADGEPCHWFSIDPPICSACVDLNDEQMTGAAESTGPVAPVSGGMFSAERCPGSPTPALHAPIFVDAHSGYCARCRTGFVT